MLFRHLYTLVKIYFITLIYVARILHIVLIGVGNKLECFRLLRREYHDITSRKTTRDVL